LIVRVFRSWFEKKMKFSLLLILVGVVLVTLPSTDATKLSVLRRAVQKTRSLQQVLAEPCRTLFRANILKSSFARGSLAEKIKKEFAAAEATLNKKVKAVKKSPTDAKIGAEFLAAQEGWVKLIEANKAANADTLLYTTALADFTADHNEDPFNTWILANMILDSALGPRAPSGNKGAVVNAAKAEKHWNVWCREYVPQGSTNELNLLKADKDRMMALCPPTAFNAGNVGVVLSDDAILAAMANNIFNSMPSKLTAKMKSGALDKSWAGCT